jgi:DNA-binding PadR family transcriptional regulator
MSAKPDNISDLLNSWETTYRRGLLSLWLLLLLDEQPAYAYQIAAIISERSQETMAVNDQSIYRALNRFEKLGLVTTTTKPSDIGPARKYYYLTSKGHQLLVDFIRRNMLIFQEPEVVKRFQDLVRTTDVSPMEEKS